MGKNASATMEFDVLHKFAFRFLKNDTVKCLEN